MLGEQTCIPIIIEAKRDWTYEQCIAGICECNNILNTCTVVFIGFFLSVFDILSTKRWVTILNNSSKQITVKIVTYENLY